MDLTTIKLVSTPRPVAYAGPLKSADYNESMREILLDLAQVSGFLNMIVIPALAPVAAYGQNEMPPITGKVIPANPDSRENIFYDESSGQTLSITDSLERLKDAVDSIRQTVEDIQARLIAVQSRLATSNQTDITTALQALQVQIDDLNNRLSALESGGPL